MTSEETKALFARWRDAENRHDSVGVAAEYSENCLVESPAFGTVIGRADVEKGVRQFFEAFPDFGMEFADLWIEGDRVVQTVTVYGTDTGGFLGQAATDKPFRFCL